MRSTASAYTLVVFGVALGLVWSGGCDDHDSDAAPAAAASGTPFFCYVGSPSPLSSVWSISGGGAGSESTGSGTAPRAGTLKNLYVNATGTFTGAGSVTVVVRKNGADTGLLLTYTAADATTLKSNLADTVAVAAGDVLSIEFRETANGDTGVIMKASVLFE